MSLLVFQSISGQVDPKCESPVNAKNQSIWPMSGLKCSPCVKPKTFLTPAPCIPYMQAPQEGQSIQVQTDFFVTMGSFTGITQTDFTVPYNSRISSDTLVWFYQVGSLDTGFDNIQVVFTNYPPSTGCVILAQVVMNGLGWTAKCSIFTGPECVTFGSDHILIVGLGGGLCQITW